MIKNLFLLCGPSGAGKSTWAKRQLKEAKVNTVYISRDEIRFSLLKDGEDYFAHEDEVFDKFCSYIQNEINNKKTKNIFADATHLSEKARNKVLDKLDLKNVNLFAINFIVPLEVCLMQNEKRKESKYGYVPRSVIRRMHYSFKPAISEGEKYNYTILTYKVGDDDQ